MTSVEASQESSHRRAHVSFHGQSGAVTQGPMLSPSLFHILREVQREVALLSQAARQQESISENTSLSSIVAKVAERFGFELSSFERDAILAQIEKDKRPFGILQELVDDTSVSDIIVASHNSVTVRQGQHSMVTGVSFLNQERYEAFVEKLLNKAKTSYSTKIPIADGMIGSFARIHVVHRSIAENGPYLTIRLNRFSSVSLQDLNDAGLAPKPILDYLLSVVGAGNTLLLAGEVGTGKTTLARALAGSMPKNESLLVIEDTPEIRLEHPVVRYLQTREANADGAGRVRPSECIRAGMRMAMNRIIFGEIRDAEAAESFVDVCASGHPGLSTVHAKSALDTVSRLELFLGRSQRGVNESVLQRQIATAVQCIVHIGFCPQTSQRRILEVLELGAVADGGVRHRKIFQYKPTLQEPKWQVTSKVSMLVDSTSGAASPFALHALGNELTLKKNLSGHENLYLKRN